MRTWVRIVVVGGRGASVQQALQDAGIRGTVPDARVPGHLSRGVQEGYGTVGGCGATVVCGAAGAAAAATCTCMR